MYSDRSTSHERRRSTVGPAAAVLVALASGSIPDEASDSGDEEVEWQSQGF
jgi:hypothetical protein